MRLLASVPPTADLIDGVEHIFDVGSPFFRQGGMRSSSSISVEGDSGFGHQAANSAG